MAQEEIDSIRKTLQKINSTPRVLPDFQQTSACWDRGLTHSLVLSRGYSSGFQDFTKDMDAEDDSALLPPTPNATLSTRTQMSQCPPLPPKVLRYVRPVPSSFFHQHQVMQAPTSSRVDLAKQERLDIQILSQKMVTATECV